MYFIKGILTTKGRQVRVNSVLVCYLMLVLGSCVRQHKEGYFSEMPRFFHTDSLDFLNETFESFRFEPRGDCLESNTDHCELMPFFCGILSLKNDTIFFRKNRENSEFPFLILTARRFDSWNLEYKSGRIDSIISLGLIYDKFNNDSINVYELIPKRITAPMDDGFINEISLGREGIRYITYSSWGRITTIKLGKYPKVVYTER